MGPTMVDKKKRTKKYVFRKGSRICCHPIEFSTCIIFCNLFFLFQSSKKRKQGKKNAVLEIQRGGPFPFFFLSPQAMNLV